MNYTILIFVFLAFFVLISGCISDKNDISIETSQRISNQGYVSVDELDNNIYKINFVIHSFVDMNDANIFLVIPEIFVQLNPILEIEFNGLSFDANQDYNFTYYVKSIKSGCGWFGLYGRGNPNGAGYNDFIFTPNKSVFVDIGNSEIAFCDFWPEQKEMEYCNYLAKDKIESNEYKIYCDLNPLSTECWYRGITPTQFCKTILKNV